MRFGRLPARHDPRVPLFSGLTQNLPPPPLNANWLADIDRWYMLGNDEAGNCVPVAAMHYIWQQQRYKPPYTGPLPTTEEAIANYSAIGGFVPGQPSTDNGLAVQGPGGLMSYWLTTGLKCCGVTHKIEAYAAIEPKNSDHIRQAINTFGAVLGGIDFPVNLMRGDVPFVWNNISGPREGHEVLLVGFETAGSTRMYDLISWGEVYRIPEPQLLAILAEATVVLDPASMDARGRTAAGYDHDQMVNAMKALRAA